MSTDTKYNGWTNYETWLVNLWMTNDQGGAEQLEEDAKECVQAAIDDDETDIKGAAVTALADRLEQQHDEAAEQWMPSQACFFADLINAGLQAVNWHEIAQHAIDEIDLFSAGWNMPGYMPEATPVVFMDADDALEYIKDELGRELEHVEIPTETIDSLTADDKGEFGQTFGKFHYFVTRL